MDGQQRLTTLVILLKAIHKLLEDGDDRKEVGKLLVKADGILLILQTNNANRRIFEHLSEGREGTA